MSREIKVLNADSRLYIGGTFTNRTKQVEKLSWILQGGLKSNIKDQFSALFPDEKNQNDIGVSLKLTIIGNGYLDFKTSGNKYQLNLIAFRNRLLKKLSSEMKSTLSDYEEVLAADNVDKETGTKLMEDLYPSAIKEYQDKYIGEETDYIIKKN